MVKEILGAKASRQRNATVSLYTPEFPERKRASQRIGEEGMIQRMRAGVECLCNPSRLHYLVSLHVPFHWLSRDHGLCSFAATSHSFAGRTTKIPCIDLSSSKREAIRFPEYPVSFAL